MFLVPLIFCTENSSTPAILKDKLCECIGAKLSFGIVQVSSSSVMPVMVVLNTVIGSGRSVTEGEITDMLLWQYDIIIIS